MILLSIIVTVYNIENYITRCIESLLDQEFCPNEYEIILINDGSTDNSEQICQHYAILHNNIILINQINQGVSAARNLGLEIARGKYICFVDGDDYLISNGLSTVFSSYTLKDNPDVTIYQRYIIKNHLDSLTEEKIERQRGKRLFVGNGHNYILSQGLIFNVTLAFFKKSFLLENNLKFLDYTIAEDFLFFTSVLFLNPSIISTSYNIYRYIVHENSITTTRSSKQAQKCVHDYLSVMKNIQQQLSNISDKAQSIYSIYTKAMNLNSFYIYKKILIANYSTSTYISIINEFKKAKLLPIIHTGTNLKCIIGYSIINLLTYIPILYKPTSFIYNHILVKYILKL